MDFPVVLDTVNPSFVYGMREFRQVIKTVLKEQMGNFLQSRSLGARFSVHSTSVDTIQNGVKTTLESISGVQVKSCKVNLPDVQVSLVYKNSVVNFQFNIAANGN